MQTDFTATEVETGGLLIGPPSFATPELNAAESDYVAPPGATEVAPDAAGNRTFQLTDAANNVVQWSIDALGNAFNYLGLGPATPSTPTTVPPLQTSGGTGFLDTLAGVFAQPTQRPSDPRDTYVPAVGWRSGTDAQGNPLFRVVDEASNLIEWGINSAGDIFGIRNLGASDAAGNLRSGVSTQSGGILNDLNNIATGNNTGTNTSDGTAGTIIAPNTVTSTINNFTSTVGTNAIDLANTMFNGFKNFLGVGSPATSATNFAASNDRALGTPAYPGNYAVGQKTDLSQNSPGAPSSPAALLTGLNTKSNANTPNLRLYLVLALVAVVGYFLYKRARGR